MTIASHRSIPAVVGLLSLGLVGCIVGHPSLGETDAVDDDASASADEASSTGGSGTATADDGMTGQVSLSGTASATTDDGSSGTEGGNPGGAQHPACDEPLPDPLPPLPTINLETDGTPSFALWQTFSCEDAAVLAEQLCDVDGDCSRTNCVDFGSGAGVCSYADIDIWCDGEGEVIGSKDGSCWICVEPTQHARACCDDPLGVFDCRSWPYADEPGIIGQVCATHDDCEAGLQCSASTGEGYGICACPGTPSGEITPADTCFGSGDTE
jgi:hypothetical protein